MYVFFPIPTNYLLIINRNNQAKKARKKGRVLLRFLNPTFVGFLLLIIIYADKEDAASVGCFRVLEL